MVNSGDLLWADRLAAVDGQDAGLAAWARARVVVLPSHHAKLRLRGAICTAGTVWPAATVTTSLTATTTPVASVISSR